MFPLQANNSCLLLHEKFLPVLLEQLSLREQHDSWFNYWQRILW